MFDSSMPYVSFSTEPLGVIEAVTALPSEDLVAKRFRRLSNEIARLRNLLAETTEEVLNDR